MIRTMSAIKENMYSACKRGFINATDLADYLAKRGMPFRSAYKTVGTIVGKCVKEGKALDELTLDEYKEFSDVFDSDLYSEISLENCVAKRVSRGGTGYDSVNEQIVYVEQFLK